MKKKKNKKNPINKHYDSKTYEQIKKFNILLKFKCDDDKFVATCRHIIENSVPDSCPFGNVFNRITALIAAKQFNRIYNQDIAAGSKIYNETFYEQSNVFFRYIPELLFITRYNCYANKWDLATREDVRQELVNLFFDKFEDELNEMKEASAVLVYACGNAIKLMSWYGSEEKLVVGYHVFYVDSSTHIDYSSVAKAYCLKHEKNDVLRLDRLLNYHKFQRYWQLSILGEFVSISEEALREFYNKFCSPTLPFSEFCSIILPNLLNAMSNEEWKCVVDEKGNHLICNYDDKPLSPLLYITEEVGPNAPVRRASHIFDYKVNGHYRHYKSGKKTWVKSHQRHGYAYRHCS